MGKIFERTFSLRMLFNLLFVTSLGFNIYFLAFQYELTSVASAYDVGLKVKKVAEESTVELHPVVLKRQPLESGLKTNIHEEESVQNFNLVETSSYKVEPVLLDSSIQSNESNIHSPKVKSQKFSKLYDMPESKIRR